MRRGPGWAGESGFLRARPTARAARSGTRPRACNLNRPSPFARRPRFPPPEARNRSITNPAPASPSRGPPQRHRRPIPFHCCMRGNRGNNKRETIVIWEQSNHRNALGEKIQAGPKTLACVNFRLVGWPQDGEGDSLTEFYVPLFPKRQDRPGKVVTSKISCSVGGTVSKSSACIPR